MLDWKLRKGALNGEEILHAGADYQDNVVTTSLKPILPLILKLSILTIGLHTEALPTTIRDTRQSTIVPRSGLGVMSIPTLLRMSGVSLSVLLWVLIINSPLNILMPT